MASPVMRQSPGIKGRPETDSVHDHMTRLRMKMVQQKIQNEKDRIVNRPPSEESTNNDLENQARLQQAMLRRQELLDNIRREQLLNDETKRPRTYSPHRRRYTPSPVPPASRRSLQDLTRYNMYNQVADTYRSRPDMPQVKHVIEHTIKDSPRNKQYALPPINQVRGQPVVFQQPPPPQIIPMQQQAPAQIIQAPAPQHIITGYPPGPVIHNLSGQPEKKGSIFNREEFGDMMMMQNAQMHQMVMQKMMLGNLGRQDIYDRQAICGSHDSCHGSHDSCHGSHNSCHDCHSGCCSSHGVHGHCGHVAYDHCLPMVPRVAGGAVHHHHYSNPPSQPAPPVTHYTTVPAMDVRGSYGGFPYGDYSSAYVGPARYDDGDNYYTYH